MSSRDKSSHVPATAFAINTPGLEQVNKTANVLNLALLRRESGIGWIRWKNLLSLKAEVPARVSAS